jgi:ubiquinone/menaquinone biosynthesis C-methylase UbiE
MSFDEKAKDWDKDPKKVERARIFANEIVQFLGDKKIENAFEFGSGTGLVSFNLKDYFRFITLADNSGGMIEVLTEKIRNEKVPNMKPLLTDIFKNNSVLSEFDIIYTLLTLHHINDTGKILGIFNSILSRGGYLCIGDLVIEDGSFHHKDHDFEGHRGFDPENFKKLLTEHGFTIEYEKIFSTIEREYKSEMRKYPMFIIIGKKL